MLWKLTFYEPQAICYAWQCRPSHNVIPEEARAFCENIAAYMERRDGNAHSGILCTGAGSICIAAHTIAFGAGMDDAGAAQCRTFGTGSTAAFF